MRRQPVAFFLGDAAFLSDSKFRALVRRLPDPDDFNSAVGAFFIALAYARRNGTPDIDTEAETGLRFLPDLIAVGLLTDTGFPPDPFKSWAPTSPQQVAGMARAQSAERDPTGRFAPSDAGQDNQRAGDAGQAGPASPPLYSIPFNSREDSLREAVPSGEIAVLTWLAEHGCYIRQGNGFHQKLVLALERHDSVDFLDTLERLSAAGVRNGDVKGLVFGAIDALDAGIRPSLSTVVREEHEAEVERAKTNRWAKSAAKLAEYRAMIEPKAPA